MTEHDALLHAICHHPDDDTPRLIFADYLDENGEPDRAAFIRAQVEAARLPDWEPFPVHCRHRKPEWFHGKPWASTLPAFDGWHHEWVEPMFQRGFGSRVRLRSLIAWEQVSESLLNRVPLRDFWLRAPATLDDWRKFAAGPWTARMRCVHLESSSKDPLRALWETERSTGIADVHVHVSNSPGIGALVMDFLGSPMGRAVRGLHFHVGYTALEDLIDAMTPGEWAAFERLSFINMGLTGELVTRWCERGGVRGLEELDLCGNATLQEDGFRALSRGLADATVNTLGLAKVWLTFEGIEALLNCEGLASVRRLDLSQNSLRRRATKLLANAPTLAGLRALNLSNCQIGSQGVRHITQAKFWPNLVELDLRNNPITVRSAKHLLNAEVPRDLTALLFDVTEMNADARTALRQKFGEAVLFHG